MDREGSTKISEYGGDGEYDAQIIRLQISVTYDFPHHSIRLNQFAKELLTFMWYSVDFCCC